MRGEGGAQPQQRGPGEEHRPESADAQVKMRRREAVDLGIGLQESDVAQTLPGAEPARVLEHPLRQVDTQCTSGHGGPGGVPGGLARPAADIKHPVAGTGAGRGAEPPVEQARLGVEHAGVPDPVLACRAIPLRGLLGISPCLDSPPAGHHHHRTFLDPAASTTVAGTPLPVGAARTRAAGRLDVMRQEGSSGRRAIAWRPGRLSLQVRLVVTALCLAAGGAGIIGAASDLMARGYLMRQADQQLRGYADRLASRPFVATPLSAPAPGTRRPGGGAFSIEVLGAAGQLVMRAGSTVQPGPAIPAAGGRIPARAGQLVTIPAAVGGSWRVIAEPVHYRARRIPYAYSAEDFSLLITSTARPGLAGTLVVGLDLGSTGQAIHRLTITCLTVSGVVLLVVGCLSAALIRAALRPLTRARETAEAIAAGELSRRVPDRDPRGGDGRLARSLNEMLSQVEHAFSASAESEATARESAARMRQIVADAAHELRAPLSVIHGLAQHHRQRGQVSAAELDRIIRRLEDETARISVAVGNLLRALPDRRPE